jgi:hypothetical protein
MRINKITFRNNCAWLAIYSKSGEYLGTWHVVNIEFVDVLRNENPNTIRVW